MKIGSKGPGNQGPSGTINIAMTTAAAWAVKRGKGGNPRKSSAHETSPRPKHNPRMGRTTSHAGPPSVAATAQHASTTPISAMPPPRGTGRAWLDRSLG